MTGNVLTVSSTSIYSAEIHFEQLTLNDSIAEYYYYVIQYEENGMNFTGDILLIHDISKTSMEVTIEGLSLGTSYTVQVVPFRRDIENNLTEPGWPSHEMSFTTGWYNPYFKK